MKIPSIITGILASSALTTGCIQTHTTGECGEPTREEDISGELMVSEAEDTLQQDLAFGESLSASDCATLCESLTLDDVESVDACASEWIAADAMTEDTGSGSDTAAMGSEASIRVDCTATVNVYCMGRRPIGHEEARACTEDPIGRFFAEAGHLEAASVVAFRQLAEQLEQLGAPKDFVERCRAAAWDEVCHARDMARMARRSGTRVPEVVTASTPQADLFSIARHNAIEGCVHETWAAMLAGIQAERAATPRLRALFREIADDEMRHGQLAWDLHHWFMAQLDADDRAQIHEAQQQALRELPTLAGAQVATLPKELGGGAADLGVSLGHRLASALAA